MTKCFLQCTKIQPSMFLPANDHTVLFVFRFPNIVPLRGLLLPKSLLSFLLNSTLNQDETLQ